MNILCFGDSNTYGISPLDGKRFDEHTRWPCLLADKLGAGHLVIEAGLPNRTIADEPPFSGDKLGVKYLEPYLRAYHVDVIIIQLGTNDLKRRFGLAADDIAKALDTLIVNIENHYLHREMPKIVVLSPSAVYEVGAYQSIYAGAAKKAKQLTVEYKLVTERHECHFINGYALLVPCQTEGVHWQVQEHKLLADYLFEYL